MRYKQTDFLKNLKQDENIYLLGFLWADGYIGKKYDISIEIKRSDFNYIRPLFKKYGYNKFYTRRRTKNNKPFGSIQENFHISNKNLNLYLKTLGYTDKSTISPAAILSKIPMNKRYLWWRGYIDGDGCFYCRGTTSNFSIWSTINQDWSEVRNLYASLGIGNPNFTTYTRKNGKHCSSVISLTAREKIKKLGDYLYQDNLNIGFKRKYDKYKLCISSPVIKFKKRKSNKKGVRFSIHTGQWIVRKTINGKRVRLGTFKTYKEACSCHDEY